jgi:uncharacterized protein YfdQ (DUF2303 family)
MDNIDLDKITDLATAAVANIVLTEQKTPAIALPKTYQIHNLEILKEAPQRHRGEFRCKRINPFLEYCRKHASATTRVFVNPDTMTAKAIFDLIRPNPLTPDPETDLRDLKAIDRPDWGTHTAICAVATTPSFMALLRMDGTNQTQADFIDWCENWAGHIVFFGNDNKEIVFGGGLQALRVLTVKNVNARGAMHEDLHTVKTTFEEIEVSSDRTGANLPTRFSFHGLPYSGFEAAVIDCRIRIGILKESVSINYRTIGLENDIEHFTQEFMEKLSNSGALAKAQVFIGTYTNQQCQANYPNQLHQKENNL